MLRWWESITGNLVLSTELKMQIGYNVQSLKADVLSVSPLSEQLEEWWVVCGFICRKWSYTIGGSLVGIWWQENKTKLVE